MAFNVRPGGAAESVEVPASVKSGDIVRVNHLTGIAQIDATEGEDGNFYTTVALEGIGNVVNETGGTIGQGEAVYTSDAGPGAVSADDNAEGKLLGIATRDSADGEYVWVKLIPNATVEV